MKDTLDLIGRILLGFFFANEAYDCIVRPERTRLKMAEFGLTWQPEMWIWLAAIFLVLGSVMLIIGYRSRLAALFLLAYWLPLSFLVHPFWATPYEDLQPTFLSLMRYLAIAGALLLIVAHGTGKYAVRKILASTNS